MSTLSGAPSDIASEFKMFDRKLRKRPRHSGDRSGQLSSSDEEDQPPQKVVSVRASKGRLGLGLKAPSASKGHCVGLVKAQIELAAGEKELELEVAEVGRRKRLLLKPSRLSESSVDEATTAGDYKRLALDAVDRINHVARRSSNLKGTFTKALNDAATAIKSAVVALHSATSTVENAKLERENGRLREEVAELRKEVVSLRADLMRAKAERLAAVPSERAPADLDTVHRAVLDRIGTMFSARFEAIESRLLPEARMHPPLASDPPAVEASVTKKRAILCEEASTSVRHGDGRGPASCEPCP